MTREQLPERRNNETTAIEFGGEKYIVTVGYYNDGRVGEIFIDRVKDKVASKLGYQLDGVCRDSAMTMSLLLQNGSTIEALARTITRDEEGLPASIIGAICDHILEKEKSNVVQS